MDDKPAVENADCPCGRRHFVDAAFTTACAGLQLAFHEQPARHDFVFSPAAIAGGATADLRRRHQQQRRFLDHHRNTDFVLLDIRQLETRRSVYRLFDQWAASRDLSAELVARQRRALQLLIALAPHFALLCTGVVIKDELVAFAMNELAAPHTLAHAGFAQPIDGLMPHLLIRTAEMLRDRAVTDWNHQDAPTPQLAQFKRTFAAGVLRYFEVRTNVSD